MTIVTQAIPGPVPLLSQPIALIAVEGGAQMFAQAVGRSRHGRWRGADVCVFAVGILLLMWEFSTAQVLKGRLMLCGWKS